MVGHTPALIASLITCIQAREYTPLPSKWIIGWDMSLQGKKSANSSNTSMQDWKSTFHKQSWSCGAMENQEFMHTNKLPNWVLCALCERIWECSIHLFYCHAGSENRGAGGLPWDDCSSCNANMTEPAGFLALKQSTGLPACVAPYTALSLCSHPSRTDIKPVCPKCVLFGFWPQSS